MENLYDYLWQREKQPKDKTVFRRAVCLTERLGSLCPLNSQCMNQSTITIVRDNHKSLRWREKTISKF